MWTEIYEDYETQNLLFPRMQEIYDMSYQPPFPIYVYLHLAKCVTHLLPTNFLLIFHKEQILSYLYFPQELYYIQRAWHGWNG